MNWKEVIKETTGKSNDAVDVIFTYLGELDNIRDISTSCGCTDSILEGMFLKVKLRLPEKYPQIEASIFETQKFIYVTYKDNTEETLIIKATVYE